MSWYVVHTKSRHEYKAHSGLIQKNLTTFLPEIETWSKQKDRKKKIHIPSVDFQGTIRPKIKKI